MTNTFVKLVSVNTDPDRISEIIRRTLTPARYECLPSNTRFHHKLDFGTACETHVWTTQTDTGYSVASDDTLRNHIEVHFVEAGRYQSKTNTQRVVADAGQAYLLVDPEGHRIACQPGTIQSSIAFPIQKLSRLMELNAEDPIETLRTLVPILDVGHPAPRLIWQIGKLLQGGCDPDLGVAASPIAASLLEEALLQTLVDAWPRQGPESRARHNPHPRYIKRAMEWIDANLSGKITLESIAEASGVGVRTLQTQFRTELGMSPIQYVIKQRLQAAHRELIAAADDQTIAAIAAQFGFGHMGEFDRRYKEVFGRKPSETRRSSRHLR
ncbi:helix-turn-helix domain-containing protein [Rhizobium sp. A22-96]